MFERPEPDEPTPITYAEDGSVFGHLALWDTCHMGLSSGAMGECVKPPRSVSDYRHFHLGEIATAEGDRIAVGNIVLATGHASTTADLSAATRHYDDTGSVGAFVRASNGNHGIWLSGVQRSDLTPEQLRDLRANSVSGDWRVADHNLELVAALAVPVPGFPIPRAQLALAASGEICDAHPHRALRAVLHSERVEADGGVARGDRVHDRRCAHDQGAQAALALGLRHSRAQGVPDPRPLPCGQCPRAREREGGRGAGAKSGVPALPGHVRVVARIQGHPSRAHLHAPLMEAIGLPCEVMLHASDPPNPWEGYKNCLRDIPECSHLLVIQDDTRPALNLAPALERIAEANPSDAGRALPRPPA